MATVVVEPESITEQFGPHLSRSTGMRLDAGVVPDKAVETHCCFCGQQCGIELLVKDNQVIGYEPWYDFPFNRGKLCPKGVKRYLQGAHADRLLHAYKRDSRNPHGFSPVPYDEAIRKVAEEIDRVQTTYGPKAFATLSGASLTTEKCYLMGKFARICLKTPCIDYNGRLCMVSAGAGNKNDRANSTQTVPVVCMHCDSPTCAEVCPAHAIKRTGDGVVQSARKPRCIACNNCVLACPFGIPKMNTRMELMMKCDQCYDRTSIGKLPMCASVCPSQALFFGTEEEITRLRPKSAPVNTFQFGAQTITTRTRMLVPKNNVPEQLDVLSAMHQPTIGNVIEDDLLLDGMDSEDAFT